MGEYTYIGEHTYVTKASIGRYCSIANNVTIGPGEHHTGNISTSALFYTSEPYEIITERSCVIGNDVWIGADSIIRRGVAIGNGAVVGANSFVNMDIPDFAVACGSPARIIHYRFSEEICKKISESRWWDYGLEEARQIIERLALEKTRLEHCRQDIHAPGMP